MSREWKVGDRFSTEGVVTALPDSDGNYLALFDGHTADGFVIAAEMAHAKLIESTLDLNKPMRVRFGSEVCRYLATDNLTGDVYVQFVKDGSVSRFTTMELENVPEEKRKVWAKYYLVENAFMVPIPPNLYMESIHGKIIGQKILEITEGDGMEDEQ